MTSPKPLLYLVADNARERRARTLRTELRSLNRVSLMGHNGSRRAQVVRELAQVRAPRPAIDWRLVVMYSAYVVVYGWAVVQGVRWMIG